MKIAYSKNARVRTRIAVLSTLALLFALTLALTAAAQELRAPLAASPSTSEFRIYLPVLRTPLPPYALQFDGLDDFASIADQGDFDFDQAFTVEAWVKPLSLRPYDNTVEEIGLVMGADSEPPIPWTNNRGWGFFLDTRPVGTSVHISHFPGLLQGRCCLRPWSGARNGGWPLVPLCWYL